MLNATCCYKGIFKFSTDLKYTQTQTYLSVETVTGTYRDYTFTELFCACLSLRFKTIAGLMAMKMNFKTRLETQKTDRLDDCENAM